MTGIDSIIENIETFLNGTTVKPVEAPEVVEPEPEIVEQSEAEKKTMQAIKALAAEDFMDENDFFKLAEMMKGIASAADEVPMAAKFVEKIASEVKDIASDLMGDDDDDDSDDD